MGLRGVEYRRVATSSDSCPVFGCESSGFVSGCTDCKVEYKSDAGFIFWVSISNRYVGDNPAECGTRRLQIKDMLMHRRTF